jgi:hypothetical protein
MLSHGAVGNSTLRAAHHRQAWEIVRAIRSAPALACNEFIGSLDGRAKGLFSGAEDESVKQGLARTLQSRGLIRFDGTTGRTVYLRLPNIERARPSKRLTLTSPIQRLRGV